MLRTLSIENMLLIEAVDLEFSPGLNVLTGETGAGKSILLDSLGSVLGWRGRGDMVRQGASSGEVTAIFELPNTHPAKAILEEAGIAWDDDLILRRTMTAQGRKSAFVNDKRVSAPLLREIGETLIELHGQHDDRGLLNAKGHMDMLDTYAGHGDLLIKVRSAWKALQAAQTALDDRRAALEALEKEEDFLRHAVAELTKFAPEVGEDKTLDSQRRLMQAAEKIRDDLAKAHGALGGDRAEGALQDALRWVEGAADHLDGTLDTALGRISETLSALADAQAEVEQALSALDFDTDALEQTEERLFALRALARKHGVQSDELPALAQELAAKLDAFDQGAGGVSALEEDVAAAQSTYDAAAQALTASRTNAAAQLDAAMQAELAPLKMERARFETSVTEGQPGPNGVDSVQFGVATNPGAPAGPLNKIASGGELSRFLLALKVCLSSGTPGRTMIFDEIDRGVGGATADAVGTRLAQLGQGGQVLVVTHSPQVAAKGGSHHRVEKHVEGDVTTTLVRALSDTERTEEVARMLSGADITDAAKAAATELLSAD
ncbi:MAG: DNA repair protein RecN [Planktomarina sp.]